MSVDDFFTADTGSATTGAASLVLTVPRSVAAGKKLVLAHGRADVTGSTVVGLSSVTDSKGNTWTVNDAISIRANQGGVTFAHCDVATPLAAGDTITVTQSATAARKFLDIWVCSGLNPGGPHAGTGTAATANTNSGVNGASATPSGSVTTSVASTLLFGAVYMGATGVPATAGSGYTLDSTRATSDAAPKGWASEHQATTTTGAETVNFAAAASSAWALAAVAFAAAAGSVTANAGSDVAGIEPGKVVALDGSGSTGAVAGYSWRLVSKSPAGAPTPALSSTTAQKPTYIAPAYSADATYTWGLTVTDGVGGTSAESTVAHTVTQASVYLMTATGWAPARWGVITA